MTQPPADDLDQYLAERWHDLVFATTYHAALQAKTPGIHVYLSTACLHGAHETCKVDTFRYDGTYKVAASCKSCGSPCMCPVCHMSPRLSPSGSVCSPETQKKP
jgi:hypothetical protein